MNCKLALIGVSVLGVAGMANADYVSTTISNLGDLGGGSDTYRVFVNFDAPDDALLAVGGLPSVGGLSFSSTGALVNSSLFGGLQDEDKPQPAGISDAWDSWLSVGDPSTQNTSFSPGFAGGDGVSSVVNGSSFSETDGGYFDSDPTSVEGGVGALAIAQFTISGGGDFTYSAVASWRDDTLPGGEFFNSVFSVTTVPAPGALALLGLAGFAGRRRR